MTQEEATKKIEWLEAKASYYKESRDFFKNKFYKTMNLLDDMAAVGAPQEKELARLLIRRIDES